MTRRSVAAHGVEPADPRAARDDHHASRVHVPIHGDVHVTVKPGVRGFPDAPPGARELGPYVARAVAELENGSPRVLDATGAAGAMAAVAVAARSAPMEVRVVEPSAAALSCAATAFEGDARVTVLAACIWDAHVASGGNGLRADLVACLPPADRGTDRVHAEIAGAARALSSQGSFLFAVHKDRGGKRYVADATRWFEDVSTVGRVRGWRIALARRPRRLSDDARAVDGTEPWLEFEAAGRTFAALPGVFAAGKLDPGTNVLLDALTAADADATLAGARVLDLGCGYGALAVRAAAAGGAVTAVDDDLAAVRSARRSAELAGAAVTVLHSDLDAAFAADERFDAVLCNPPFHVAKAVRLDVSQAFTRAARRRLEEGGVLWLVANRALPYERYLEGWRAVDVVHEARGFKVVRAVR